MNPFNEKQTRSQIMKKAPRARPDARPIVVRPPQGVVGPASASAPPSEDEARAIAEAIRPQFAQYAAQYDTKKYRPDVYERVSEAFRHPDQADAVTLREALLWKYGHRGKPKIPPAHERLISQLQHGWPAAVAGLPATPRDAFVALDRDFGGKTRFITVAFLLHLLHPTEVPIIDQHNFRAVNALLAGARPRWGASRLPSRYEHIELVAGFMSAVLAAWRRMDPVSAPSIRDLDKFLMMYGKAIKARSNKRLRSRGAALVAEPDH